jgi:hypothetical protein
VGEYQVRISLAELRYLTVTCPACGAQVTFDLARANHAVHCVCNWVYPSNLKEAIAHLQAAYEKLGEFRESTCYTVPVPPPRQGA